MSGQTTAPGPLALQFRTIDELVRMQARALGEQPILAYPSSGTNYVDYSLKQLDSLASHAAAKYVRGGLSRRESSSEGQAIVALLGVSDIDYVTTLLAVSRLGHIVLLLSPRLPITAYRHLLTDTGASHLIFQPKFSTTAAEIQNELPDIAHVSIATPAGKGCSEDSAINEEHWTPVLDLDKEQHNTAWIFHSSGSTGLPKPVPISHGGALSNYRRNIDSLAMSSFLTLPLFHTHGTSTLFRAFFTGKQVHMYNASLPLTKQNLIDSMRGLRHEIFCAVPYAFKLLGESDEGIDHLRSFSVVTYGGSACPEALGDMLAEKGVNLVSVYGMSELGPVMTSSRPSGDRAWNYLRPNPTGAKYLRFEDRGEGLHELVCLDGWPSKSVSNRPDGSYATKDLFLKHTNLEAWKYVGRLDDVVVLETGEKANPIPIEGAVRQHALACEAVVFGAQKSHFGIAVVASEAVGAMSNNDIKSELAAVLEKSQASLPAYARIAVDMMLVFPPETDYPKTDKGTVIRQSFYKRFQEEIDDCYQDRASADLLALPEADLREFIRSSARSILRLPGDIGDDQDFFELGFDSLQATQLRGLIAKSIDVGGQALGMNIVFDYPQVKLLAQQLLSMREGHGWNHDDLERRMTSMIKKYQPNPEHWNWQFKRHREYVAITGVTGSLGAHITAQMASRNSVERIYCLVRACDDREAHSRMVKSFQQRGVWEKLGPDSRRKLVPLSSDTSKPTLGLDAVVLAELKGRMTTLYHCAWKVNFNQKLESFEKDSLQGLKNLIEVCLACNTPLPPRVCFCSSIGTVLRTDGAVIDESVPPRFENSQLTGYGQSKLVAEHICAGVAAATDIPIYIVRIGQLIGDTERGIWNHLEAMPLMMQTAKTIGALPTADEELRWLPVDVAARCLIDITSSGARGGVFNLVNNRTINWTRDLLPMLRRAGLEFETLDPQAWLQRLRRSEQDPVKNAPIRLIEYFERQYGTTAPKRQFQFRVERSELASEAFRGVVAPDEVLIGRIVSYLKSKCW